MASGEPWSDSVVLWTRLAPEPLELAGGMPPRPVFVHWEVSQDMSFSKVVRSGLTLARPEEGHSVHVEVDGLQPEYWYYYRFHAAGESSPVGRTKTAPLEHARVESFRYAFASCQDYEDGYYTAYEHLAEEDLDLVVFLGDYIYEGAPASEGKVRYHSGTKEIETLDEYRQRYAQYRSDVALQTAHANFPWVPAFDDHEVDNDWSSDIPQDPDQQPRDRFLARRANAFQAFWEFMPLRRSAAPRGPHMLAYRTLQFGDLVSFNVLDTRQYRSVTEPCGYGTGPLCDEVLDPSRTMLGRRQERWLRHELTKSHARWNVLAQQVPVTQLDVEEAEAEFKWDKWDAYPVARKRLLRFLAERGIDNPVVITGDLHDNWAASLKRDFNDPESQTIAAEFIGTSISSDGDGAEMSEEGLIALSKNPHVKFHNYRRGYVRCDISEAHYRTDFRVVPFVEQPGADVSTRATFMLDDGNPEMYEI